MKTQGGIKGVGNNSSALEEHFLVSCVMSQITEAFLESLHLNSAEINREDHYQFTGRTNKRITDNVGKLKEVMKAYDATFDKTDSIFNIISKWFLQGQMGQLDESQVNKSTKDKVDDFLHLYWKVKSNLHIFGDGSTYYWTVYPITQINILVINCILVCKLYICQENFTK